MPWKWRTARTLLLLALPAKRRIPAGIRPSSFVNLRFSQMRYGLLLAAFLCLSARALDRPGVTYKIFQFPPDKIPRVDGNPDDWAIVPDEYAIGMDQLVDDTDKNRK